MLKDSLVSAGLYFVGYTCSGVSQSLAIASKSLLTIAHRVAKEADAVYFAKNPNKPADAATVAAFESFFGNVKEGAN